MSNFKGVKLAMDGTLTSVVTGRSLDERKAADLSPKTVPLRRAHYPTGSSQVASAVREHIAKVARFDTTVLILGESGTGKELAAQQVHALSARAQGPFVPVNCGAIPAELLESELFGHERGAFTGAIGSRQGRFEIAEGGTLFLDEIGEMSPHMQVKLLRVLQHKSFERVGSNQTRNADVRIVAATHRNLEEEVRAGRFREDLFFRLNVYPIHMPALRERHQDLPALIDMFHGRLELCGYSPVNFTPDAVAALRGYAWPGNVRELENLLERLAVLFSGESVDTDDLPERYRLLAAAGLSVLEPIQSGAVSDIEEVAGDAGTTAPAALNSRHVALPIDGLCLKTVLADIEQELIRQALMRSDGVVSRAAKLLGLGRTTLLEKMRRLRPN